MVDLSNYGRRIIPGRNTLEGECVTLEPLNWVAHGNALSQHLTGPGNDDLWTYISIGPFKDGKWFAETYEQTRREASWQTLTIIDKASGDAQGILSYMRIRPKHGSVEVGCVVFGKALQNTSNATEAIFLMAQHVFDDLGYRRFEWKCDSRNKPSLKAAKRLGFTFEGVFRNDLIVKGRNRDTAWFSITDDEWPNRKARFEAWLDSKNFDAHGQQKQSLSSIPTA
jgi:RimJ/RimL family protein N-acetyltransferase